MEFFAVRHHVKGYGFRMKKALITGVTGQDGAYLVRLLLAKGYEVHGIKRRASSFNTARVDDIYEDPHNPDPRFFLHYGDLTDSLNVLRLLKEIRPDEIYNLAAQSHVQVSFETPEYTANVDAIGTLRMLEAIRTLELEGQTRFYQASTSELYGKVVETPQSETTPFYPRSPYAAAKLYAYWICVNYRREKDIARSTQIRFEDAALHCLDRLHSLVPTEQLVMAGGCALNGVANARILRETPFSTPYLQAAASDDGTCLGAALWVWHNTLGQQERFHKKHAFWGPEYSDQDHLRAIRKTRLDITVCSSDEELVTRTADLIAAGHVTGWYQGRSEWGPRALGNRSILANPCLPVFFLSLYCAWGGS